MLSKKEVNQLKALMEREDLKGKKWIEDFIWRNTTKAKYEIGDIVKFSDYRKYHYGVKPINWVGKIIEVTYHARWGEGRAIRYTIEYQYKIKGTNNIETSTTYINEDEEIMKNPMNRINLVEKKNNNSDYFYL